MTSMKWAWDVYHDVIEMGVGRASRRHLNVRVTCISTSLKWAWDVYFSNIKLGVGHPS